MVGSGRGGVKKGAPLEQGEGDHVVPRRQLAGGDWEGRPALGALGGRDESRDALDFGIVGVEGGVPRRAELGGHGDGGRRAWARGGEARLWNRRNGEEKTNLASLDG